MSGLVGAGVAIGVIAWEPWEEGETPTPTPTTTARRLTGTEAAALAWQYWADEAIERAGEGQTSIGLLTDCQGKEFNDAVGAWVVTCTWVSSVGTGEMEFPYTYRVYDSTGRVERFP